MRPEPSPGHPCAARAVASLVVLAALLALAGQAAAPRLERAARASGARAAAPDGPLARAGAPRRPVVWVQAGHRAPREPGYRAQTGAAAGPFGGEIGFTTRLASGLVTRLRRQGVDARPTPGRVTPWGARGAAFVSLHHDSPGGRAAVAHAVAGGGENWYHGEGVPPASPAPYPDSAPHRRATRVSRAVQRRSRDLARRIARRYRPLTSRAGVRFAGVVGPRAPTRLRNYYGFYRTRVAARVIVEAGAAGADDAFLSRPGSIAAALSRGIADHLRAHGLLGRQSSSSQSGSTASSE